MKMLVVKDIEVLEADRDMIELALMDRRPLAPVLGEGMEAEFVPIKKELVVGRHFVNANGDRVFVGMSRKVQELIGLPFEVFEEMEQRRAMWEREARYAQEKLYELKRWKDNVICMSFWKRFLFFITGRA